MSLIEILVGGSLLSFLLLGIMASFLAGSSSVDEAGRISRAVALAQQNLEHIRKVSFPPSSGSCPSPAPPSYTCSLGVSLSGSSPNRLGTVTATVTWVSGRRSGTVQAVTRIAE